MKHLNIFCRNIFRNDVFDFKVFLLNFFLWIFLQDEKKRLIPCMIIRSLYVAGGTIEPIIDKNAPGGVFIFIALLLAGIVYMNWKK